MGACRHDISTKTEFSRKRSTYIVIPCRPARVQLHVKLPLLPGQLIVLGLFFSGQGMPLRGTWDRNRKTQKHHNLHQGEKRDSVLGGGGGRGTSPSIQTWWKVQILTACWVLALTWTLIESTSVLYALLSIAVSMIGRFRVWLSQMLFKCTMVLTDGSHTGIQSSRVGQKCSR